MKKIILIAAMALLLPFAAGAQQTQKINKKNLVIKEWNSDPKGTNKVLDHVTTYNADGQKIEEIEYSGAKQKWRKRWEYGASGKATKELVYDERNRLQTYKTFEYNELSRKKIQYTYNAKGKLLSIKQYEYLAQDAGN